MYVYIWLWVWVYGTAGGDFVLLYEGPFLSGLGLHHDRADAFAIEQAVNTAYFIGEPLGRGC